MTKNPTPLVIPAFLAHAKGTQQAIAACAANFALDVEHIRGNLTKANKLKAAADALSLDNWAVAKAAIQAVYQLQGDCTLAIQALSDTLETVDGGYVKKLRSALYYIVSLDTPDFTLALNKAANERTKQNKAKAESEAAAKYEAEQRNNQQAFDSLDGLKAESGELEQEIAALKAENPANTLAIRRLELAYAKVSADIKQAQHAWDLQAEKAANLVEKQQEKLRKNLPSLAELLQVLPFYGLADLTALSEAANAAKAAAEAAEAAAAAFAGSVAVVPAPAAPLRGGKAAKAAKAATPPPDTRAGAAVYG